MFILDCRGTDGENYCFKAHKIPTKEEFDKFVRDRFPDRIGESWVTEDGDNFEYQYNDIEIEAVYEYEDLDTIN